MRLPCDFSYLPKLPNLFISSILPFIGFWLSYRTPLVTYADILFITFASLISPFAFSILKISAREPLSFSLAA